MLIQKVNIFLDFIDFPSQLGGLSPDWEAEGGRSPPQNCRFSESAEQVSSRNGGVPRRDLYGRATTPNRRFGDD